MFSPLVSCTRQLEQVSFPQLEADKARVVPSCLSGGDARTRVTTKFPLA
jgi:hypothetical protein